MWAPVWHAVKGRSHRVVGNFTFFFEQVQFTRPQDASLLLVLVWCVKILEHRQQPLVFRVRGFSMAGLPSAGTRKCGSGFDGSGFIFVFVRIFMKFLFRTSCGRRCPFELAELRATRFQMVLALVLELTLRYAPARTSRSRQFAATSPRPHCCVTR